MWRVSWLRAALKCAVALLLVARSANAFVSVPCGLRGSFRTQRLVRPHALAAASRGKGALSAGGVGMQSELFANPFVTDLLFGGIAGTVSNLAVFPIDLVKTKLQSNAEGSEHGALATLMNVVRADGVGGLWSGSTPVLLGSAPESALQLAVHTWLIAMAVASQSSAVGENDLTILTQIICGCVAGASTILVTNPMVHIDICL